MIQTDVRTLPYAKVDILAKLKANRAAHVAIFASATVAYRAAARKLLLAELANLDAGKKFKLSISLTKPENHADDYDAAIARLEMATLDIIQLSTADFNYYFLDKWGWDRSFKMSNSAYTAVPDLDDDDN